MSDFRSELNITLKGHVLIVSETTGEILLDEHNDIHPQNAARMIARKLSNEDNSYIFRLAFGDGGSFTDTSGEITYKLPNDGNNGGGWESRLYHETYAEVVDDESGELGSDPGSSGPDNIRIGDGALPLSDPPGTGTLSNDLGQTSDIIITMYINENEPAEGTDIFIFNELGLYSSGLGAVDTPAVASVDVGDKQSDDNAVPALTPFGSYSIGLVVDGVSKSQVITLPSQGSGVGGLFTYGDVCEGLNTGNWYTSGDILTGSVYFYITDHTGGDYPTIAGKESFGFLTVQSKTTGDLSTLVLTESTPVLGETNLLLLLGNSLTSNVNVKAESGQDAGVKNNLLVPDTERERLMSHLIFSPISKAVGSIIKIVYTIIVGVAEDNASSVIQIPAPSPTPSPTITVTPSITPTHTVTPTVTPTHTVTPTVTPTIPPTPSVTAAVTVTPAQTPAATLPPPPSPPAPPVPYPVMWDKKWAGYPGLDVVVPTPQNPFMTMDLYPDGGWLLTTNTGSAYNGYFDWIPGITGIPKQWWNQNPSGGVGNDYYLIWQYLGPFTGQPFINFTSGVAEGVAAPLSIHQSYTWTATDDIPQTDFTRLALFLFHNIDGLVQSCEVAFQFTVTP